MTFALSASLFFIDAQAPTKHKQTMRPASAFMPLDRHSIQSANNMKLKKKVLSSLLLLLDAFFSAFVSRVGPVVGFSLPLRQQSRSWSCACDISKAI
jgi:hypothetical protein